MTEQRSPLFYQQPAPMTRQRHGGKFLRGDGDLRFAEASNAIPLCVGDFSPACHSYPIVFAGTGDIITPTAVVGLVGDHNLFIGADGKWDKEAHIPAYVRRYPFILADLGDRRLTLCIDEGSNLLLDVGWMVNGSGVALYDGEEPSEALKSAFAFCQAFQTEFEIALAFAKAVDTAGVLIDHKADITLPAGRRHTLGGFRVIDEAKLRALPDETVLDWHRKGWLGLAYAHLASMRCWRALLERHIEKNDKAA